MRGRVTGGRGGGRQRKQRAGRTQLRRLLAGHARGAHSEHGTHVCDAGRVEAQRLVEHLRVLPSRKGSMGRERGDMRRRASGGRGAGAAQALRREGPTAEVLAGHARSAPETCSPWS
eukprot:scaffold32558_cov60-Phaeocystis_antarctica.AAC.3